jgi:hypothetical protein
MYGGKWVFFVAVILNISGTLLAPVTAVAGYPYIIIMRILMGLGNYLLLLTTFSPIPTPWPPLPLL